MSRQYCERCGTELPPQRSSYCIDRRACNARSGTVKPRTKNPPPFLAGNLTVEQLQGIRAYWEGSIQRRKNAEHALKNSDQAVRREAEKAEAFAQGQLDGMERTLHLIFGIDPHAIITIAKYEADPPTMPDHVDKARENLRAEAEKTTPKII